MGTIFFSHDSRDKQEALSLAIACEEQGYRTWVFEIDSIAGPTYLEQTLQAIEKSSAFLLLITNNAVTSSKRQVYIEIVRAHETGKPFIPLLIGLTHNEFQDQKPTWHYLLGGAASLMIPASGVSQIIERLVSGLKRLGVSPGRPDYERLSHLKDELESGYRSPECHHGGESPRDLEAGDISPSGGGVSSEHFPTLESADENSTETLLDGGDDENQGVIIILQTSPPKIWKFDGERQGKICIGRQGTNDIIVSSVTASRKHAMISFDPDRGWIIKDLDSLNKTRVNGRPIQEKELQRDDLIELGNTCFIISQLYKPDSP